jgi:hypothetical protein
MLDNVHSAPDLLSAIEAWQPDQRCLAAGDEYVRLALRCYAAGGLCDRQIDLRLLQTGGVSQETITPELERFSAAWTVARHAAWVGQQPKRIAHLLGRLSIWLPGSPDDPDEIASLVRAAVAEVSS